ncbi:uncharacterized protein NECHADRAFT_85342 [Fusarium vanettenii 77-13-4]|uniref:FAS1 domain-containing protein n=1 Tax=Fusarium vanettenii (strain ATCC MYA-4622 / CBS 123669 / FGSC 9596 / NRRL 45880 / 77-13-4) TaxID=660122 RepID=C7ZJ31_FUSV7|nr:uncharacterized protein NECHADRAFT_85342 [Fusarium vanettenii 77-13-4]EEU36004.1 hypothetical protein NECHADRAFT_85342 [Fusarium vanettenii 77-13-4]
MRSSLCQAAASFALLSLVGAQSLPQELSDAISDYPTLSLFRSLIGAAPQGLTKSFSEKSTDITVLVPTNDAIEKYLKNAGVTDVTALNEDDIQVFFSYHIMAASLQSSDFDDPKGKTVPTLLQSEEFNNRTAGPDLVQDFGKQATGQVVFASKVDQSDKKEKRQDIKGDEVNLRSGLAQDVKMTAVDGKWGPKGANTFQVVNSVLLPPRPCSVTVRTVTAKDDRLEGLDKALNATGLWPALDHSKNVTCLAPSTKAFEDAGELSKEELTGALLAHTLDEVTYTDYLTDGMVIGTLNKTTVRVFLKGDDIYFNNAKVIKANVITNNGLIHMLDQVIQSSGEPSSSAKGVSPSETSSTTESSSTTTETGAAQSTNAASTLSFGYAGAIALIAGLVLN